MNAQRCKSGQSSAHTYEQTHCCLLRGNAGQPLCCNVGTPSTCCTGRSPFCSAGAAPLCNAGGRSTMLWCRSTRLAAELLECISSGGTGAGAAGCTRADGAGGAAGVGAGGTGAGCAGPGNAGAVGAGSGDTGRLRPYFVPPASVVRCEHVSRPASPVRAVCTGHRVPHPRPPHVPGTHHMALRPSSVPQRVSLPSPPASSLTNNPDPESDFLRAARPTISRLLATVVTEPSFESAAASALVVELVDFAAACRLDYAASLVAESESFCPPSVRGEYALCTDVLEDKHEDFKCFGAVVPHLVSMLHAPEGDQDAPDIPTSRSYAEAITGPYPSHWQTTMDAEIAFWKSTST
ncbi:unnamed protein product [Closterium sp. NIES-54]